MKLSTTLALVIISAALVFAIVGVERRVPATKEAEARRRNPVAVAEAAADTIEIENKHGKITLARREGAWRVARPFDDFADPEKVSRIFSEIETAEWLDVVKKDEFKPDEWKKTRLHDTLLGLRILGGGAMLAQAAFGSPAPLDGCHYAVLDEPKNRKSHHLVRTALPELVALTPAEWRDPRLVRFAVERVTGVVLSSGSGRVEIARKSAEADWKLLVPLQTSASEERVSELLATLANLKITSLDEAPASAITSPANGAVTSADLLVRIESSGIPPVEIRLRKPAEQEITTSASVSHRTGRFIVTCEGIHSLWAQPNDLRDQLLARFDQKQVVQIRIASGAHPEVTLRKQDKTWFMARHGKDEPANGERAALLLEALRTHRIREFVADSASQLESYGLDKPFLTLAWTLAGGSESTLIFGQNSEGSVFAKYQDQPFVYRVAAAVLAAFPPDPVKWKGLTPVYFSIFDLRRITRIVGTAPPSVLDYDAATARWSGDIAGKDVTSLIDRVRADQLAARLSHLQVSDWLEDRTDAFRLLRSPVIQIHIGLRDAQQNAREIKLAFSPTQAGMDTALYYGQVEGSPDVFFITRESLRALLEPVLRKQAV